jgi:hypothetical protein
MKKRYFISYRRAALDDQRLANYLKDGLERAGHEVFIDVGISVGTDWSAEIDRRIDWCDVLLVLLSEQSIHSEMVQGEVRRAHHRRRPDGRPRILPVRIHYQGPLDYELDSYLARIQYAFWDGDTDSDKVLAAVLDSETPAALATERAPSSLALPMDPARPRSSADPRILSQQSGGTLGEDDPFYVRRAVDAHIAALAPQSGRTLVIKAPRQMGKSSLLCRYLAICRAHGKVIAYVDFQRFTDHTLSDYATFLTEFADELTYALDLDLSIPVPEFSRQQKFIRFVRDRILARVGNPVVFAFDEVDRVLATPWQSDFFAMLRSWHNDRALDPHWRKTDLALVIATEPYLLIERADQSPFNVVPPTELAPFTGADLDKVNAVYGSLLGSGELDQLKELLDGHPFLTRLAFYRLAMTPSLNFRTLVDTAARDDGPFGDHLHAKLMALQHNPALLTALKQLIAHRAPLQQETYWRLHGAGLVRRIDNQAVPANLLYARFFKAVT